MESRLQEKSKQPSKIRREIVMHKHNHEVGSIVPEIAVATMRSQDIIQSHKNRRFARCDCSNNFFFSFFSFLVWIWSFYWHRSKHC